MGLKVVTWRYAVTISGGQGGEALILPYADSIESLEQGLERLGVFLGARRQELGARLLWVSLETSLANGPSDMFD